MEQLEGQLEIMLKPRVQQAIQNETVSALQVWRQTCSRGCSAAKC